MSQENVRLEHAFMRIRNQEESLEFYQKLFPDWIVRWTGKGLEGNRWIHFGPKGGDQPGYLSLYEVPKGNIGNEDELRLEVGHVGFSHGDVEGLVTRMRNQGIEPTDNMERDGFRRAYFQDPNGHELEFVQRVLI